MALRDREQVVTTAGQLFVDEFVQKEMVDFDQCTKRYEKMTQKELVAEMDFLMDRPDVAVISFELTRARYIALLIATIKIAGNWRHMPDNQRSDLVNLIVGLQSYIRGRLPEELRLKFDQDLSAQCDLERKWALYPKVSDLVKTGTRNYNGAFETSPIGVALEKSEWGWWW